MPGTGPARSNDRKPPDTPEAWDVAEAPGAERRERVGGSWRIGRLFGIDVRLHWTFLLLVGWVLFARLGTGAGLVDALRSLGFVFAIFGCIILHECGHALAARRYGIGTRDITILPIGGLARLDRMPEEPMREIVVALAGPLVNVAIALVLGAILLATRGADGILAAESVEGADPLQGNFLPALLAVNVLLVAFNLLPAFPMDGGRVLRGILGVRLDHATATRIAAAVGQVVAVGFAVLGLMIGNPFLLFIALFVFIGASAEARHEEMRYAMRDLPVHVAMVTRFRSLQPDDTIAEAADALIHGTQTEFPVVDGDRLVGVLGRDGIMRAIREGHEDAPVSDSMQALRDGPGPNDRLDRVFQQLQENGHRAAPVLDGGRVVGLVTLENLGEWVMLAGARRAGHAGD